MSDDLISRKALLEKLEEWCGSQTYLISEEVWKIIKNSPKAFDKEKVIEEIKDESRVERLEDVSISGNVYGYNIERVINEEDVIEIIEKGGIE